MISKRELTLFNQELRRCYPDEAWTTTFLREPRRYTWPNGRQDNWVIYHPPESTLGPGIDALLNTDYRSATSNSLPETVPFPDWLLDTQLFTATVSRIFKRATIMTNIGVMHLEGSKLGFIEFRISEPVTNVAALAKYTGDDPKMVIIYLAPFSDAWLRCYRNLFDRYSSGRLGAPVPIPGQERRRFYRYLYRTMDLAFTSMIIGTAEPFDADAFFQDPDATSAELFNCVTIALEISVWRLIWHCLRLFWGARSGRSEVINLHHTGTKEAFYRSHPEWEPDNGTKTDKHPFSMQF